MHSLYRNWWGRCKLVVAAGFAPEGLASPENIVEGEGKKKQL
jgi:hypothetical protein